MRDIIWKNRTICIFFQPQHKLSAMIVVTATLILLTLMFAPIYVRAEVTFKPSDLAANVKVRFGPIRVFDEQIVVKGKNLLCNGTVDADVDVTTLDGKSGVDLLKCVTVDKLFVTVSNNICNVSMLAIAVENAIIAFTVATVCNLLHCQVCAQCLPTSDVSQIKVRTLASFSVAELSFCLLKQGVRKWIRKSEK